jgi:hypothetical protein
LATVRNVFGMPRSDRSGKWRGPRALASVFQDGSARAFVIVGSDARRMEASRTVTVCCEWRGIVHYIVHRQAFRIYSKLASVERHWGGSGRQQIQLGRGGFSPAYFKHGPMYVNLEHESDRLD